MSEAIYQIFSSRSGDRLHVGYGKNWKAVEDLCMGDFTNTVFV